MTPEQLRRLDKEVEERLYGRWGEDEPTIEAEDIFRYKQVVDALGEDKILLSSLDLNRLLTAVPFSEKVMVHVCVGCAAEHGNALEPFLDTEVVLPVLSAPYAAYPPDFVSLLLKYPHIAQDEYNVFRWSELRKPCTGHSCPQCASRRRQREILDRLGKRRVAEWVRQDVFDFFHNLHPFLEADADTIDVFDHALKHKKRPLIDQLVSLSYGVEAARAAQAFNAALPMSATTYLASQQYVAETDDIDQRTTIAAVQELLVAELGLSIPVGFPVDKYLGIILDHRSDLRAIVSSVAPTSEDQPVGLSRALDYVASLNAEIRKVQRSTRHAFLEATTGFIRSNKTLSATVVASGVLGLGVGLSGCGAAVTAAASGKAAALARRALSRKHAEAVAATTVSLDPATRSAGRRVVERTVGPIMRRLLAGYYGVSVPALHVWRIRQRLADA